jgi:hypothetical protein
MIANYDKTGLLTYLSRPIRVLIEQLAKELGLTTRQMPGGADHDAQDMARLAPVAMIFIAGKGGISHSPKGLSLDHRTSLSGATSLLHFLLRLDVQRFRTVPSGLALRGGLN